MLTKSSTLTTYEDAASYSYDQLSRPTLASIPAKGITNGQTWDALSRLTAESGPLGTTAYAYDTAGRRTQMTWPDGFAVTYDWDAADRMTAIRRSGSPILQYGYDAMGRRASIARGNGVGTSYQYDGIGRLTQLAHTGADTAYNVAWGYGYNPAGQIVSRTTSNPAYAWTPPAEVATSLNDRLNRVTSVKGLPVSYDPNGNITNDTERNFGFDAANRLITNNAGGTLAYDALGRLDVLAGANGGRFVYEGAEISALAGNTVTIDNRFIRGPGVDEIVANYTGTATPAFYWLLDERNSLAALTNPLGAGVAVNAYDDYGQPRPGNAGRFQYTGQLWMPDFGAYHYKARAYQPRIGRFLQTDPIGYAAGANLYGYVGGDPVNFVNPAGLERRWTYCLGDPQYDSAGVGGDWLPGQPACRTLITFQAGGNPSGGIFGWGGGQRYDGGAGAGAGQMGGGGISGYFPGSGSDFARPPIQSDPTYRRYNDARNRAIEANAWMVDVALAPVMILEAPIFISARAGSLFTRVCNCFVEGTEVSTPEGLKPIEQVSVGDLVLARDDETGETAYKPVVALIAGDVREIWEVTVETTDARGRSVSEPIGTTDEHPWRTIDGRWVETRDLTPGTQLVSIDGGRAVVTSVLKTDRSEPTYNFEVQGFHTYFVGESQVWVHNACPRLPKIPSNIQQNRMFQDATRGLTEAQRRLVHQEITGQNYTYQQIREIANMYRTGRWW